MRVLAITLAVTATCLAADIAHAQGRGRSDAVALRIHTDARFRTQVLVPTNWRERSPDDWDGRRFVSPDGEAWLAVYGASQDKSATADHMQSVILSDGEDILYLRHGRRWLVVSGVKDERIFYRKAILTCGDTVWHHIAFEYPAEQKRAYDALVTVVARSLRLEPGGCERREPSDPLVGQSSR